jgi:AcrR family transcriptional regulator
MAPRTSEQYKQIRSDRKVVITDAALHVFAEEGYHSASMSLIAKKAGISKGLIYNYFESKEALLKYIMIALVEDVLHMYEKDGKKEMTRADFIHFLNMNIDLVLKDTKKWKLYFTIIVQPQVMALVMAPLMERMQPFMKLYINYFKKKGHEDPVAVMRYFSAVLDGIQMHIMLDPVSFPVEQAKKMIIKQFA